jgi:NAD-dependent SIR2 family protein deacetylase
LAKQKDTQIMTENFDFLQEQAGVKPSRVSGERLKSDIDPEWLKEIDGIICIGLSYDDRGLLGWYKKINPAGKIISLDFNQPSYLGVDDYLVQGDLQTTLPEVEKQLNEN